jgi:hypothetical protein
MKAHDAKNSAEPNDHLMSHAPRLAKRKSCLKSTVIDQIKKKALSCWDDENQDSCSMIVGYVSLPAWDTAGPTGSCSGAGLPRGCDVSDKGSSMLNVSNA